jgi:hypothetical protein
MERWHLLLVFALGLFHSLLHFGLDHRRLLWVL